MYYVCMYYNTYTRMKYQCKAEKNNEARIHVPKIKLK